jgi:hypothetical protein
MHNSRLNDSRFATRMKAEGVYAEMIREMFQLAKRKVGITQRAPVLTATLFRRAADRQGSLFE